MGVPRLIRGLGEVSKQGDGADMQSLAGIKTWLYQIFTHNYAEQLRIGRAVQRKKFGLEQDDNPYPGAVKDSGNSSSTVVSNGTGNLKGTILGATLLGLGILGTALGLPRTVQSPTSPSPTPITTEKPVNPQPPVPPVLSPTSPPEQHYEAWYEQQNPDGSWTNHGPADTFTGSGKASGRQGKDRDR